MKVFGFPLLVVSYTHEIRIKKLVSANSFKVKGKRNLDLFQTNMCFEI